MNAKAGCFAALETGIEAATADRSTYCRQEPLELVVLLVLWCRGLVVICDLPMECSHKISIIVLNYNKAIRRYELLLIWRLVRHLEKCNTLSHQPSNL